MLILFFIHLIAAVISAALMVIDQRQFGTMTVASLGAAILLSLTPVLNLLYIAGATFEKFRDYYPVFYNKVEDFMNKEI